MLAIHQYLRDQAQDLIDAATERWVNGTLMAPLEEAKLSIHANLLLRFEALSFEDINEFYQGRSNNEAETG